ncbi:hypothetical protein DQ04_10421010 [Trypanosoma grayi]|uniref:hypothetical protein n=1 Tax=Trypanosoma grayi TaxID=71804 RepID=UPI0004F4214E|nr:hypothetical protein DQ04_10421010 [Trypanosoma grayi]KEG07252.1 hypothetical protein DQ04_10421010 [Trypanosoma grayi]
MRRISVVRPMRLYAMGEALCSRTFSPSHGLASRPGRMQECCHIFVRRFCTTKCGPHTAPTEHTAPKKRKEASTQLKCPECGKRFLSVANLQQHRRSRHLVTLTSPAEERLQQLRKTNVELQAKLRELQKVNALRADCSSSVRPSHKREDSPGRSETIEHFPAVVPEVKAVSYSLSELQALQDDHLQLGTGISEIRCVGVVEDDIEVGFLGIGTEQEGKDLVPGLEALQFTLRTEGYRQRRVGQLKMYLNRFTVRVMAPRWKAQKGDVVLVAGVYGLHKSYDLVSKKSVENVVVEAGYVGLLERGFCSSPTGNQKSY